MLVVEAAVELVVLEQLAVDGPRRSYFRHQSSVPLSVTLESGKEVPKPRVRTNFADQPVVNGDLTLRADQSISVSEDLRHRIEHPTDCRFTEFKRVNRRSCLRALTSDLLDERVETTLLDVHEIADELDEQQIGRGV